MYGLTTPILSALSALVKYINQMFQLSATGLNLCPRPKSSLINHLIDDGLLDA